MYERVVLAYDGSAAGRVALREGAVLARSCGAKVFLLAVVPLNAGHSDDGVLLTAALDHDVTHFQSILDEGLAKLCAFGLAPTGRLIRGDPARVIGAYAAEVGADLVVVGHRRQSLAQRWWSGPSDGYLVDHLTCSVLVARNPIEDGADATRRPGNEAR
jgi:nucleotide-binding universal stress UspA family protein